ncbi:MAG: hypothetical protein HOW73_29445 [Polyangiaceae bacterium]|nr:hypothetical protein [Polyangiaceae bacterium]
MQSAAITAGWRSAFGDVAPIGHLCRRALPDRWLRIHNLPGGRRYPASPGDYTELLSRQNAAATTILGLDAQCILFFCDFPDSTSSKLLKLLADPPQPSWLPELAALTDAYEQFELGALAVTWKSGQFDGVLRARADDDVGPLLFANLTHRTAFAPYDGGADLFLASPQQVMEYRRRWSDWLSPRADQL